MVILESIDAPVRDLLRPPLVDVLGGVDLEKPAVCIHADGARHVPGVRLLCLRIGQFVHANTLSSEQDILQSDGLRFRSRHTVICVRNALCCVFCHTHGITLRIHRHVSCGRILRNTWASFAISGVRALFPADSGNAADDRGNEGVVADVLRGHLVGLVTEERLLNGDIRQVLCRLLHSLTQSALEHGPGDGSPKVGEQEIVQCTLAGGLFQNGVAAEQTVGRFTQSRLCGAVAKLSKTAKSLFLRRTAAAAV